MNRRAQYGLRIGGKELFTDRQKPHVRIYDGMPLGMIAQADPEHVRMACHAAEQAMQEYALLPLHQRAALLNDLASALEREREDAATLIVSETAKPLKLALAEIDRAVTTYRLSAEEAKRLNGETIRLDGVRGGEGKFGITRHEPLGVVAAITPFNFPFNLVAHKLGPALAAGNGVVLKPAGMTPLCAAWIVEAIENVGFPPGIVNLLFGSGAEIGDRLITDPSVAAVSFTGSDTVGKQIRAKAGLRKTILELGSNSAVLLDQGTALDAIVPKLVSGAFAFCGQVCISIQRIAVHRSQAEELISKMSRAASIMKVTTDPMQADTDLSVMISPAAASSVRARIDEARRDGAKIVCGDRYEDSLMWPTILTDCPPDSAVITEELFAPVAVVEVYDDWEEAIRWINRSRYGLNTGVFTNDLAKAWKAATLIQSGAVLVNEIPTWRSDRMPYGGVKESGTGREGVPYTVRELSHEKLIVFNGI